MQVAFDCYNLSTWFSRFVEKISNPNISKLVECGRSCQHSYILKFLYDTLINNKVIHHGIINLHFKNILRELKVSIHTRLLCPVFTWLFFRYCCRSILYHVFKLLAYKGHAGRQLWWADAMFPSLWTKNPGILSSYEPKLLSEPVKRITSAYPKGFVFGKELMYSSKDTLNSGPQVGNVPKSWSLPPGTKLPP